MRLARRLEIPTEGRNVLTVLDNIETEYTLLPSTSPTFLEYKEQDNE